MPFTDRFIRVPCFLYNTKEAEMGGYNEQTKGERIYIRLNPVEIAWYREGTEEDSDTSQ